jgi:hypothetical protein
MTSVTFEFKSAKHWEALWEALYDTSYKFASYGYKAITVWGEKAINEVRTVCEEHNIKVKEI